MTDARKKIEMEFGIRSAPQILFQYISTPSGLVEWFCDDVNIKGKNYTFVWDDEETTAELVKKVNGKYIKFKWEDSEKDEFLMLEITRDELTRDLSLIITDWVDEDEEKEMVQLWESQVQDLKNALGLS